MIKFSKEKLDFTEYTGYKIVSKNIKSGDYHSFTTGQKYNKGWLPKEILYRIEDEPTKTDWSGFHYCSSWFNKEFSGYSAVFDNRDFVERMRIKLKSDKFKLVIVKAKVIGKLIKVKKCVRIKKEYDSTAPYAPLTQAVLFTGIAGRKIIILEEIGDKE